MTVYYLFSADNYPIKWFQSPVWQAMAVYENKDEQAATCYMFQSPVWQAMAVYVEGITKASDAYVSITCMASHGGVPRTADQPRLIQLVSITCMASHGGVHLQI